MVDSDSTMSNGEWWIDPWWENSSAPELPYPIAEIRDCVEVIRIHFDACWAADLAKHPSPNIVFPNLGLNQSISALKFIVSFGSMLRRLNHADGLSRLIVDLKGDKGESAYMEMQSADAFARLGFSITFPKEGKVKSPDVLATDGQLTLAIECKRLREQEWESWEDALMTRLSISFNEHSHLADHRIEIQLNPRLSEIRFSNTEERLNQVFFEAIIQSINGRLRELVVKSGEIYSIDIPGVAGILVADKTPAEQGLISGMHLSSPALFRRIFQNGLLRAMDQLPKEQAGLAVIYSDFSPGLEFFEFFFQFACREEHARFQDLLGVALFTFSNMLHSSTPVFFINPFTVHGPALDIVSNALSSRFGALVSK